MTRDGRRSALLASLVALGGLVGWAGILRADFGAAQGGSALGAAVQSIADVTSAADGQLLYWGGSGWVNVGPGTSTQVLTSNGAGSAPSFQAAAGGDDWATVLATGNTSGGTDATISAGDTITVSNGATITSPGSGASSEKYGQGATATGLNALAIGNTANASDYGTAIGQGSLASANPSVAIGNSARATGGYALALGYTAQAATNCTALGGGSSATGTGSTSIGRGNSAAGGGIAIGQFMTSASGQCLIGNTTTPITDVRLGAGATSTAAVNVTLSATGQNGTNMVAGSLRLGGPLSTGNAAEGTVQVHIGAAEASGTTVQTASEVARFERDGLDLADHQMLFGASAGSPDVGLMRNAAGDLLVTDGSTGQGRLRVAQGTLTDPAIASSGDDDTGIFFGANGEVYVTLNTITRFVVSGSTGIESRLAHRFEETQTVSAPAISFQGDTDTGLYWVSANTVGVGAGAGKVAQWDTTGIQVEDDKHLTLGSGADVFQQGETTTLTDGSATTVLSVVTADGDMPGLVINYTVQSTDGTEYQAESGTVQIAIVDDAGGVVASTPGETSVQALSSGTLTTVWSVVTTDDQSIEVQLTATSSLTTTTHQIRWHAVVSGDVTLTVP